MTEAFCEGRSSDGAALCLARSRLRALTAFCAKGRGLVPKAKVSTALTWTALAREQEGRALAALARRHKAHSAFHAGLAGEGGANPAGARNEALTRAIKALILDELRALLSIFERHNEKILIIKGPALSIQLFGDPFARDYSDLDLLVRPSDFFKAVNALREAGFSPEEPLSFFDPGHSRAAIQPRHHITFSKPGRPFHIELHVRLNPLGVDVAKVPLADLFARSCVVKWENMLIPTLSPADHAVFAISHGTRHGWNLLHWILDAAAIFSLKDGNLLDSIEKISRETRMERQLSLAFFVAEKFFEIAWPFARAPNRNDARIARAAARRVERNLVAGNAFGGGILDSARAHWIFLPALFPALSDKISIILYPLRTPAGDAERLGLPRSLAFLALPLRPFFVASRAYTRKPDVGTILSCLTRCRAFFR